MPNSGARLIGGDSFAPDSSTPRSGAIRSFASHGRPQIHGADERVQQEMENHWTAVAARELLEAA